MTALRLTPVERAGLAAFLRRLLELDDRAAVRLQARGPVAGIWAAPPFGVLAMRPVALLEVVEDDRTVSARRLAEALDGADVETVLLPDSVLGPPWAALLPPQSGWEFVAETPVAIVADQVGVMIEGFRRRADLLPVGGRTPSALTTVAEELWEGPSIGGIPMRAAHAAAAMGLLGRRGTVAAWRATPWMRLGCPGGSVAVREATGTDGWGGIDVLGAFETRVTAT